MSPAVFFIRTKTLRDVLIVFLLPDLSRGFSSSSSDPPIQLKLAYSPLRRSTFPSSKCSQLPLSPSDLGATSALPVFSFSFSFFNVETDSPLPSFFLLVPQPSRLHRRLPTHLQPPRQTHQAHHSLTPLSNPLSLRPYAQNSYFDARRQPQPSLSPHLR